MYSELCNNSTILHVALTESIELEKYVKLCSTAYSIDQ